MELRKDYILDRWSYISQDRGKRANNFFSESNDADHPKNCPFCKGHESMTPEEKGRIEKEKGEWLIRWLPNKYPALDLSETGGIISDNQYFKARESYGVQEVIIETPDKRQMVDLSCEHISTILRTYNHRIEELSKLKDINYVLVFKNQGKESGASLVHSHSQVIGVEKIPAWILTESIAFNQYENCPYCEVISLERGGPRNVYENNDFMAITPYAPRFNYEIWIFPKDHMKKLNELPYDKYLSLAEILKMILQKIKLMGASYCFYVQYGLENQNFHWHLEVLPRLNVQAGFELSGGDSIISVSPEEAARFYRGE